jgi:hypothetical protein
MKAKLFCFFFLDPFLENALTRKHCPSHGPFNFPMTWHWDHHESIKECHPQHQINIKHPVGFTALRQGRFYLVGRKTSMKISNIDMVLQPQHGKGDERSRPSLLIMIKIRHSLSI